MIIESGKDRDMKLLITNNPKVKEKFDDIHMIYLDKRSFLDVLIRVRDEIHRGGILLTHPLTSSIKPDETPFKSVIIEKKGGKVDLDSLIMIDDAIEVTKKFLKDNRKRSYTEKILEDFQIIDLSVITSGIESMGGDYGRII